MSIDQITKEQARESLRMHLIKMAKKQAEALTIEESKTRPNVYKNSLSGSEQDPEDCYCVCFPNENPSARSVLDGCHRYVLISKLTGEIIADYWSRE